MKFVRVIKSNDETPTRVLFKLEPLEKVGIDGLDVVAWFVDDPTNCYAHNGQHSTCDPEYMQSLEDAKFNDYADLLDELEAIGYVVEVLNDDEEIEHCGFCHKNRLVSDMKEEIDFGYICEDCENGLRSRGEDIWTK